jgi:hypothetical protein
MPIYVFRSDVDPTTIGFTRSEAGENLPHALAPWRLIEDDEASIMETGAFNRIRRNLQDNGVYMARVGPHRWPNSPNAVVTPEPIPSSSRTETLSSPPTSEPHTAETQSAIGAPSAAASDDPAF